MGDWPTWATAFVGLLALIGLFLQVRSNGKIHAAEARPYVVPHLAIDETAKGVSGLYLVLKNHGRTAALNVRVAFPANTKWNTVKPVDYPFLGSTGIPLIAPGEQNAYFLGRLTSTSALKSTFAVPVSITVFCSSTVVANPAPETYVITLSDKFGRVRSL